MAGLGLVASDQAGGALSAVVDGDPVYLAQGSRILVVGRNSSGELEPLYATAPLGGQIAGLIRMDGYLIAAWGSGGAGVLTWFSLADELAPVRMHDFRYGDSADSGPIDIALSGHFLYVADRSMGLLPVDLSDPLDPRVHEPVEVELMDGGLAIAGTDTLLAWTVTPIGGGVVKILDISSPLQPVLMGTYLLAGMASNFDVVASGDLMVVIAGVIETVDISRPDLPTRLATRAVEASSGVLVGDRLLVGLDGAVQSWDLSMPSMPVAQGSVAVPADRTRQIARGLDSSDLVFFTRDGQALAVNAEDPAMPQLEDVLPVSLGEAVSGLATGLNGPIVINQNWAINTLDDALGVVASLEPLLSHSEFHDIEIDIETGLGLVIPADGVYTANFTNATDPELLGFIANDPEAFQAAALDGDRAWSVTSTSGQLVELDLADPQQPAIRHVVESGSRGSDITYSDGFVYVAYRDDGLGVFRVDAKREPELVGDYGPCLAASAVDVHGGVAGLACADGWHFIDVSRPESPELLSTFSLPQVPGAASILLEPDRAWAGYRGGVVLFDLDNPASPFLLADYKLAGWATDLAFAPEGVWVGARSGGIARLRYPDPVSPGHSAAWFNPARVGEGWTVEILDHSRAVGYWSTFDDHGNPRWLFGMGAISHNRILFEMNDIRGGRFGPAMDSSGTDLIPAGVVRMIWTGCDDGWFQYLPDGDVAFEHDIRRLTRTAGLEACASAQEPIMHSPADQSGTWYDPSRPEQGFSLQRMSSGSALVNWYTFDDDGNPYWMIGVGHGSGEDIVFPALISARGARFGEAFNADDVELIDWGDLRLRLDCLEGNADYQSNLPEFGSGLIQLERLTVLDGLSCE